jgi:hypothetical protein
MPNVNDAKKGKKDSTENGTMDKSSDDEETSSNGDESESEELDNTKKLKLSDIVDAQNAQPTYTAFSVSTFMVLMSYKKLFQVHDGTKKIADAGGWHYLCSSKFSFGLHKFEFGLYLTKASRIMLYLKMVEGEDYHGYLYVQLSNDPIMVSPMDQINDGKIVVIKQHVLFKKGDACHLVNAYDKYIKMLRNNGGQFYACVTIFTDHNKNATIPPKLRELKTTGSSAQKQTKTKKNTEKEQAKQELDTLRSKMLTELSRKEYLDNQKLEKGKHIIYKSKKLDEIWWKKWDPEKDLTTNKRNKIVIDFPKDPENKGWKKDPLKDSTIVRNMLNTLKIEDYKTYGKADKKELIKALIENYKVLPEKRTRGQVETNEKDAKLPRTKKKKQKKGGAAKGNNARVETVQAVTNLQDTVVTANVAAAAPKTVAAAAAETAAAPAAKSADAAAAETVAAAALKTVAAAAAETAAAAAAETADAPAAETADAAAVDTVAAPAKKTGAAAAGETAAASAGESSSEESESSSGESDSSSE